MDSYITGLASSTLGGGHKKTIHQNIPSGSVKRGPHAVVRSADLNDGIEILRRFGEGSKPLFARDDIAVNQGTIGDKHDVSNHDNISSAGYKSKTNRSSSNESSSPERYRHRDNKKHSSPPPNRRKSSERSTRNERHTCNREKHSHTATKTDRYKRKENSKSRSSSPVNKWPTEKVPYYRDEARERDRLRRLYGTKDRGRSRSRTPPPSKKYSPVFKGRIDSPKRRRSTSRDKYHTRSPFRSSRRDYRSRKSHSHSHSRTRSPQPRERMSHKHSSRSGSDKEHKYDTAAVTATLIPPTPQFIPIPMAVPADYAYSFPGWPTHHPAWHTSHHRPPPATHCAPYHMLQMMPPMMPPMRPPHPTSYVGMAPPLPYAPMQAGLYRFHGPQRFIPPRHSSHCYLSRSKRP